MASQRAKILWNSGIPISDAWFEFGPSELRTQFDQLPKFIESVGQVSELERRHNPIQHLADAAKSHVMRVRLEGEMKEAVLTDLFNGQLIATGYRESPSRSQSPVIIDPAKFENDDPDWKKGTLEASGIRYGRIRVCDPANIGAMPTQPRGSIAAIEQAIDHLIQAHPGFAKLPRKKACQLIREYLGAEQISGSGLSDKNLAKSIVAKCGSKRIIANSNWAENAAGR